MINVISKRFKASLVICLLMACSAASAMTAGSVSPAYAGKVYSFSERTKMVTMDGKSYRLNKAISEAIYPLLIKGTIVRYRLDKSNTSTIEMMWINGSDNTE